jgi:NAD(P)-dependent dehydrogenase (short-subunit alcohol dehydrogenase family)/uncharacterized OB-fold protein
VSEPLRAPRRRNPLEPLIMPAARSRATLGLTRAAAEGRFALQVCGACGAVAYPPRDACANCLSDDLPFRDLDTDGVLLAETTLRAPTDAYFRERAPWRIGIVRLGAGPSIVVHLHGDCVEGEAVRLALKLDRNGAPAMIALPATDTPNMADDKAFRDLTATPKHRRALVTDGRGPIGLAMTQALLRAGAAKVFVGVSEPWKPFAEEAALRALPNVELAPLDLTDGKSVRDCAADLGGKTDILVNTASYVRPGGLMTQGIVTAQADIDQSYLGLMRLAQAFGPAMRGRGADGDNSAVAWVNPLFVYALVNYPPYGAYCAAQAACLSLAQCLRAELRPGGVRVINAFFGPLETDWFQPLPPPKVTPNALAAAIVGALEEGLEDVFVGDVAQDVRARLRANPKAVERELAE